MVERTGSSFIQSVIEESEQGTQAPIVDWFLFALFLGEFNWNFIAVLCNGLQ